MLFRFAALLGVLLLVAGLTGPASAGPEKATAATLKQRLLGTTEEELGLAYVMGYSNVNKQHGAALLGPGLMTLDMSVPAEVHDDRIWITLPGKMEPMRSTATFLNFGFVPVTATMEVTPTGPVNVSAWAWIETFKGEVTAKASVDVRIFDASVNGQPLDLGPHCHTATPVDLTVKGEFPPWTVNDGGPLSGYVDYPPFTGCGVTEDLSPLLTYSITGKGNYTKLTQGRLCTPANGFGCPPLVPKPEK
ncbi:hypothetical protein D5S17_33620 [Pseudonocardiaceae bacterium YIM PH 21723]|nr:hypothetical protein D5S17_33620 [Pseudonocardiaceae bacterium YIM PH 21723]